MRESKLKDELLTGYQTMLARNITRDLLNDKGQFPRQALVKAGLRSGKTLLAARAIQIGEFTRVNVTAPAQDSAHEVVRQLMDLTEVTTDSGAGVIFHAGNPLKDWATSEGRTLLILESAMWIERSFNMLDRFEEDFPEASILILSSRGPEYDKNPLWKLVPGYSFNTWDLNPRVTFDSLAPAFAQDLQKAIRDFCAF